MAEVTELGAGVRRRMLLRSFAVQGSWNYQTLIGTGLAFILSPALRRVHAGDDEALRRALGRHTELFNSHPYLAAVAAGAIARLEAERVPPETVARFKAAVRGSLGTLGDRLVWLMWRPMSVLLGVSLVLAGAAWWVGALAFLLVFNALHLWMRAWGLRTGLRDGLRIGGTLRGVPFQRMGDRAAQAGALLAGLAAALAAAPKGSHAWEWAAGAAAAVLGVALGRRVRAAAAVAMVVALIAGLVLART
ncbi:PTS system mannose/fructose/sorbose family transporter subunit IID [Longimicrobium sp.]|uniref:PTS system mannose/fructose/sorbose family transporter subunit IID n=1 Tax=Longimicrobium sp. TaxID=2029185 RepID=UPI002C260703|nr:PTS system mannose/fructose/sorbose family transporter subunit IID [Longimicrobium sp.]HSU14986.1 PTS system mannose/fructose/sorbose family transporter subunit IID [Longimicrobium sp.]